MADQAQIIHLLKRTETVVRPDRLTALTELTLDGAIDDLFDFAQNPAVVLPPGFDPEQWESRDIALQWWVDRMVSVPRPLQEKLTMFWHGHFVVSWDKIGSVMDMLDIVDLYRQNAAGDLLAMTQAMALEPAMLDYLDNRYNSKWGPNQNFARELMELFTLGVGNYTEADVEAAAAAWTGHSIDWETGLYTFYPDDHDGDDKTFFGTTKNWDGPDIIDEILRDNVAKRLIAARYITKKLWEFFATPITPANTATFTPIVNVLADVLIANDMVLAPMLKAMFGRTGQVTGQQNTDIIAAFYGTTVRQGLVRTPTDFAVALSYHSGVPASEFASAWNMEGTGQVPFWPPNVSGWRPNGYWINTTSFSARAGMINSVANALAGWDDNGTPDNSEDDFPRPVRDFSDTHTDQELYDHLAAMFYRDPATEITPVTRSSILAYLSDARADPNQSWRRPLYAIGLFVMAPEFHVA